MTQKYVKTPIPPEISDKGGATIQFVDRQTVPLETSVKEAIEGLFVLGQEQLVKSNFFGLMRSASDGIRRDGHARQIGDYITIYPVVTGEFDLDRGWDPERNGVRIIARLLNELELDITKWSFEDATPGKQSFRVNTVSTLGVEGIAEIGKPVAINGTGLPKTDAIRIDWEVEGTDKRGTIPAAKVTSDDVRADIAEDALAELASEEYDGKTIVFTVRGNFSSAKIAATLKYVALPHLTGVTVDGESVEDLTPGTEEFVLTGENLGGFDLEAGNSKLVAHITEGPGAGEPYELTYSQASQSPRLIEGQGICVKSNNISLTAGQKITFTVTVDGKVSNALPVNVVMGPD